MKLSTLFAVVPACLAAIPAAPGAIELPAIIGDHMVLQRDLADPIWGWDAPGTQVTVTFGAQKKSATAGADGKWLVKLDPMPANAEPQSMSIAGSSQVTLQDILVGEVWICSGQSNMQWTLGSSTSADLETLTAKYPQIRLVSVPQVGTQELQKTFKGQWAPCFPASVPQFSGVGYFFGKTLHQALDIPIGLINNAWGGSACEAWLRRDVIEANPRFAELMKGWKEKEAKAPSLDELKAQHAKNMEAWKAKAAEAKAAGKEPPPQPRAPGNIMGGNARPGNIYAGVLHPTVGYGIKGAIWYQGETNAGRAQQYRDLFPAMITHWRDVWQQGDFPFYWVQLADFKAEVTEPGDSDWAELREAQTLTQKLPNTGQAVIIDIGEGKDIHPKNKRDVGERLARWALAKDYGVKIPYRSPEYKSMEKNGAKVLLTFDFADGGFRPFDVAEPRGFAICGADKKWVWATGRIVPGKPQIEVWSDKVTDPVAVRYAWADNPVCNIFSLAGLPLTPFRTDDFPMITAGKE